MDSRAWGASAFAVGLSVRAVVIGLLAAGVAELLIHTHLYATAVVVAGVAAVVGVSLARSVGAADRMLETFLGGVTADVAERPAGAAVGFPALSLAMRRATDSLDQARLVRQRRIDALEALLDTVTAVLIVERADGSILLANRAARVFAGEPVNRMAELKPLGAAGVARLAGLSPGGREIIRLADGQRMLAFAAQFSAPGEDRRRLISLQRLSGELDVVEQQAWRDLVRILAHEMMNSLTPISSLAESLGGLLSPLDGEVAPTTHRRELAEAVEVIARRSTGLMNFVDRYRRMAELPTPDLRPTALTSFVAGIGRLMAPSMVDKGIAFVSRVEPSDLTVLADPELMEQALINLIKNAADAVVGLDRPAIEVTCERGEDEVLIRVADNGVGPPADDPDQMFVPFFTTKTSGSGIGLSLEIGRAHV